MKKALIILMMFFCSSLASAQTEIPPKTQWRTYYSPKDNFSLETPKFVKELFFSISEGDTKDSHRGGQYLTSLNGEYFAVFSLVIPQAARRDSMLPLPPKLKEFVEENAKKPELLKFRGYLARQWIFKDNEGFYHQILDLETEERVLVFHATSEIERSPNISRFFSSIKLYPSLKTKSLQNKLKVSMSRNKLDKSQNEKNKVNVFIPNKTESNKKDDSSSTQLSPLKLTLKPRASYTDLARLYEITGDVTLKVTFSADGRIGEISPVKRLPFGLTNSAINAAKQIVFEPSLKENTPVTVTKQVQYSFTLY